MSQSVTIQNGISAGLARRNMLDFMRHTWRQSTPFLVGPHTRVLCDRIDQAKRDFLDGKSTYVIVTLPFRHGKSEISSRGLPANLFGWNPDLEIMLASYASDLSEEFSRDMAATVDSEAFAEVYPDFPGWDPRTDSAKRRRVKGRNGKLHALGMGGGATGKGAQVLILDDSFKNRAEAESETIRESRWDSLRNDFYTRLGPVHIVFIVATRWHSDDNIGRIIRANDPDSKFYDPKFPRFEVIHFRAKADENIPLTGCQYLFPERFGEEWYENQFGVLGPYASAALLQGEPFIRGGNMLQVDKIQWLEPGRPLPESLQPASLRWVRPVDLAYSEKQRAKDDPDYTATCLLAVRELESGAEVLVIDDIFLMQEEATKRDNQLREIATRTKSAPVFIEANGPQKSGYTVLRDALKGVAVVHPVYPEGDKVARAGYVEPSFDAGNVYIRCAPGYRDEVERQLANFPNGSHDDVVDMISTGRMAAIDRNAALTGKSVAARAAEAAV